MTKLLEQAIEKVRGLPAEDQDAVAIAVLSMAEEKPVALDPETRAIFGMPGGVHGEGSRWRRGRR